MNRIKKNLRRLINLHENKPHPLFEYVKQGWSYADNHSEVKGWNVQEILDVYAKQWDVFCEKVKDTNPLGFSPEADVTGLPSVNNQNSILIFAYSLALASQNNLQASILDWGGSIGHYYVIAKALFPTLLIDYHCKDFEFFAEFGQKLHPDAHFYSDDGCLGKKYDLVVSSGALQYSRDWENILAGLAGSTGRYLLITRLPLVEKNPSFVFLQRPYTFGYNTEYLAWCLNRDIFLQRARKLDLVLVREFVVGDRHKIEGAPEQCKYGGFLFSRGYGSDGK